MKIIMEIIPETAAAVNVSNPQQPRETETVNPAAEPTDVNLFDGGAFVASKTAEIFDPNKSNESNNAGMTGYNEDQTPLFTYDPLGVLNGGKMNFNKN